MGRTSHRKQFLWTYCLTCIFNENFPSFKNREILSIVLLPTVSGLFYSWIRKFWKYRM